MNRFISFLDFFRSKPEVRSTDQKSPVIAQIETEYFESTVLKPSATVYFEKDATDEAMDRIRKANLPHADVPLGMD